VIEEGHSAGFECSNGAPSSKASIEKFDEPECDHVASNCPLCLQSVCIVSRFSLPPCEALASSSVRFNSHFELLAGRFQAHTLHYLSCFMQAEVLIRHRPFVSQVLSSH
jgi:hypothetical protein